MRRISNQKKRGEGGGDERQEDDNKQISQVPPCALVWLPSVRRQGFGTRRLADKRTLGHFDSGSRRTLTRTAMQVRFHNQHARSLSRMLTFAASVPVPIGYDITPHHQPISPAYPLTPPPDIHTKLSDQLLDQLHSTD